MPKFSPRTLARIAVGAVAGVLLAFTATSAGQATSIAPRLEAPMQRLNIGGWGHSAFPGLARIYDGSLRLVFREGSDHYQARDGRIIIAESHDDGATYVNPQTVRANPDYRDPSISSIDGIEYLTWFGANSGNEAMGAGVMRAWNAESRRIDPATNPQGAISAPIVKLPDGRLGAAFYGRRPGEALYTSWMAWSSDNGWSWSSNRIVNFLGAGVATPEPYLVVNGGTTHMLFRWGDSAIGIRSSADSGVSWPEQPRQILGNATGRPTTISVAGTLVVVYREASTGSAAMAYSVDNGRSWQLAGTVLPAPAGGMMTYAAMVVSRDNPRAIRLVVGMEQAGGRTSQLWGGTVTLP